MADEGSNGHLAECRACAAAWEREQKLAVAMRALRTGHRETQAPQRVENGLAAAFRAQTRLRRANAPRPAWVPVVTWLSAAAALALAAVLLIRDREPQPAPRPPASVVQFAADIGMPEMENSAEDFIPLPGAVGLDSAEEAEVNLVRLELPRSAMAALGFEVNEETALEPVSADVMIGPDGVARAVRFLEE